MKAINELLSLNGKAAIVTGGAQGIGYGISYRLAEAGASVLIVDIDETTAQKSANELTAKGWHAEACRADVSNEDDIKHMVAKCKDTFGSLDILVNNAGIYPAQPIALMTAADFERVIDVNLVSIFLATKYSAEIMKDQRGGKIINISSIDAIHPSMIGLAHYDASKHGIWGFTMNAALEYAKDNIAINAIAPGSITTPGTEIMSQGASKEQLEQASKAFNAKIPMHHPGEPDDIGKVVLFLASDMSSYMTGSQIVVDGGVLLS